MGKIWGDDPTGPGVLGTSIDGIGVSGSSENEAGVEGNSTNGMGIFGGSGNSAGVRGWSTSNTRAGVEGINNNYYGVFGKSSNSAGVFGESTDNIGVLGICGNPPGFPDPALENNSAGVYGRSDDYPGVRGWSENSFGVHSWSENYTSIYGWSTHQGGIWGNSNSKYGVAGTSGSGAGIVGAGGGLAGEFLGDVTVTGKLNKVGGGFRIDHPLDPATKYLFHSLVESPDMKNLYDGIAVLDAQGEAVVELPLWFEALNQEFRYQLTPIGAEGPNLYIAEEISNQRFKIAGGGPGMKVCWQVTGSRKDAWAQANPLNVEQEKPTAERGRYLHPELYGHAQEQGIAWARHPEILQRAIEIQLKTKEDQASF